MISKITDYIFISGIDNIIENIKQNNIDIVVSVTSFPVYNLRILKNVELHYFEADDALYQDLSKYFDETSEILERAERSGKRVLVHCVAGISRSVTIVASYLIKKYGMSPCDAILFIRSRREIANPNPSFYEQLHKIEN